MENVAAKPDADELRKKLDVLKADFADVARLAKERATTAPVEWAKEHPLATLGIVAGVAASIGFALGFFLARGRN